MGLVIEGEHTDVNQKSSGAQHGLSCEPKFGFEQLAGDGLLPFSNQLTSRLLDNLPTTDDDCVHYKRLKSSRG